MERRKILTLKCRESSGCYAERGKWPPRGRRTLLLIQAGGGTSGVFLRGREKKGPAGEKKGGRNKQRNVLPSVLKPVFNRGGKRKDRPKKREKKKKNLSAQEGVFGQCS